GDQPDVFGNRRVGRAGPLAIDDFVKIVRRRNISEFHSLLVLAPLLGDPSRDSRGAVGRTIHPQWTGLSAPIPRGMLVERPPESHRYERHERPYFCGWLPIRRVLFIASTVAQIKRTERPKSLKLVIFDCDGTLVDSQHMIVAAMTQAYAAHSIP